MVAIKKKHIIVISHLFEYLYLKLKKKDLAKIKKLYDFYLSVYN